MTEQERKDILDELGTKVAALYPDKCGSVWFDFVEGKLKGIREEFRRRPKK